MASIDNALTTLSRAKTHMDISGNSKNTVITAIILGASGFVERYTKRKFGRATYTNEEYDGTGREKLFLKHYPIIGSVTAQRRTTPLNETDWEDLDSESFHIYTESGKLVSLLGEWYEGPKNYRFTYVAGFYLPSASEYQDGNDDDLDLPYDLELAVLDLVASVMNRRKSSGIQSQRVYQVELTYMKELSDNPMLKATLDSFKRVGY